MRRRSPLDIVAIVILDLLLLFLILGLLLVDRDLDPARLQDRRDGRDARASTQTLDRQPLGRLQLVARGRAADPTRTLRGASVLKLKRNRTCKREKKDFNVGVLIL